jgi:hypothetical protein
MLCNGLLEQETQPSVSLQVLVALFRHEVTNKRVELVVWFIVTFQILPEHVSAIRCHHHGILVRTVHQKLLK